MGLNRILQLGGAALLAAAGATYAVLSVGAASVSSEAYSVSLSQAGFTVAIDSTAVKHTGFHADGKLITATKAGASAKIELIEYASSTALRQDFDAVDGAGPKPRAAAADFAGKVLYWNENAVLAVSFSPPNEPGLAQSAADVFLGRRGTGGPAASAGGVKLPATGNGGGYLGGAADRAAAGGGIETDLLLALGIGTIVAGAAISMRRARR